MDATCRQDPGSRVCPSERRAHSGFAAASACQGSLQSQPECGGAGLSWRCRRKCPGWGPLRLVLPAVGFLHPIERAPTGCAERALPAQWPPWETALPGDALGTPTVVVEGVSRDFRLRSGPFSSHGERKISVLDTDYSSYMIFCMEGPPPTDEGSVMCQCLGMWGPCRACPEGLHLTET